MQSFFCAVVRMLRSNSFTATQSGASLGWQLWLADAFLSSSRVFKSAKPQSNNMYANDANRHVG